MNDLPEQNIPVIAADHSVLPGFVVLEGIDGAGKTYQSRLLKKTLHKSTQQIIMTSEPTRGPIGLTIRSLLDSEESASWQTFALLFAADRNEHLYHHSKGIISHCKNGSMVICDRYLFSSLAYQGSFVGLEKVWELNKQFPLPEHLFFLDIPPSISQHRRSGRRKQQYSEQMHTLHKVYAQYRHVLSLFHHTKMNTHIIDGHLSPEEISLQISKILQDSDT